MSAPRILITGGLGFVGVPIVRKLRQDFPSSRIAIVDTNTKCIPTEIGSDTITEVFEGNVTNTDCLDKIFSTFKPTAVVHTAGIVPPLAHRYGRSMEKIVYKTNVEGTRNVVKVAMDHGTESLVYTSSCCAVIDDMRVSYMNIDERWPTSKQSSVYGESKALAEEVVLGANSTAFSTCVLRPSVVCGPGDPQLVPSIHACIVKRETPYVIGNGRNFWDITYVDNVADAHVLALKNLLSTKDAAGEAFFIQNNEPITFRDFSLGIWQQFGHIPPFEIHIPLLLAWLAGLLAEMYTWITGTPSILSRGSVKDAGSTRYASGKKAKDILGYEARVGMAEAIELSCKEYKSRLQQRAASR